MDPQLDQVIRFLNSFWFSNEKTLEDVSQVSNVEFVVEVLSCLSEVSLNFGMEVKSSLDDRNDLILDGTLELREMLR
jgi:hypothetical protein